MLPFPSWLLIGLVCLLIGGSSSRAEQQERHILARSSQLARSGESLANLLTSGRQVAANPDQSKQQQQQQQQQVASAGGQLRDSSAVVMPLLSAIQTQAQRQMSQLNGLVLGAAPNLTSAVSSSSAGQQVGNVLEVLSNVGKAIQQQIMNGPIGGTNPANRFVSIVTSQNANSEPGTSKKVSNR